jgi:hypothetical protein
MINIDRLRKVHAMTTSPNPHEAAVAWVKVDSMLADGGKTRADLPGMLRANALPSGFKPVAPGGFQSEVGTVADIMAALRAARAARAQRRPEDHPDGRVGFLYRNRGRLSAEEMASLQAIAGKRVRTLSRKDAAAVDYMVQRVQARRDGKGGARD